MKTLIIIFSLITTASFAQKGFKWDLTDSVTKTKAQIYSDTKMFIAEYWKSSQGVVQNDDKEAGMILIKGSISEGMSFMMAQYAYVYNYTITFKMKDNRYKVTLDNVYCERAYLQSGNGKVSKIEPDDENGPRQNKSMGTAYLPDKKANIIIEQLRSDLQMIIDSYNVKIKSKSSSDW